ncbi:MAG: DNA double-strand break repair nuclease NurA [Dehalococcoidales bacterium]|nr:DNA double-strand break repair nuclease NurA [Dehalococcoidales bacterium]
MSLDLSKVVNQVSSMVTRLRDSAGDRQQRFHHAFETLQKHASAYEELGRKIAGSKTTYLVADPVEPLDKRYPAPPVPPDYAVLATDGSQIEVDRHRSMRCYLLNIGSAMIRYGTSPGATLQSSPQLYSDDKDLVIVPLGNSGREQFIEGNLFNIKRSVEECRSLAKLTEAMPPEIPGLSLMDGSLILWNLEGYPDFVTEEMLQRGFLACLEAMRRAGKPVASYISFPRSSDVVNALRVAICPHEPVDCDRCRTRECQAVSGVQDRELFLDLLAPGERSALFVSRSKVVEKHYGEHQVYFFYLKSEEEIARVEIPRWVATDTSKLELVHSLILDQCRRGQGYPVALSESHEQAVVTAADKAEFWQLVEASLIDEHVTLVNSAKSQSKRTRWL